MQREQRQRSLSPRKQEILQKVEIAHARIEYREWNKFQIFLKYFQILLIFSRVCKIYSYLSNFFKKHSR